MDWIAGIGFDTIVYTVLAFICLPTLIWKPRLIIYLLVVITMFPVIYFTSPISFGHVNVYLQDLIFLAYCCLASTIVLKRLITRNDIFSVSSDAKPLVIFVCLYILMHFAFMAVGVYQGVSPDSTVRRFLTYSGCLYFFCPLLLFNDVKQMKGLLFFCSILAVLYPIWQAYNFVIAPVWDRFITSSGTVRLVGSGMPLIACSLFAMLIWKNEAKYHLLSAGPIISMILIGHRSVLLALAFSMLILFILTKDIKKPLLFAYLGSFALFLSFFAFEAITGHNFAEDVIVRSADTLDAENPTTKGRLDKIQDNWTVLKKKPIMGIGYHYEQLDGLHGKAVGENDDFERNVLAPHNFVMRLMSNTGILGTFITFSIIWIVLKRCCKYFKWDGSNRNYGIFFFCSIAFFLMMSLMNTTFVSEGWVFWMLCGASIVVLKDDMLGDAE